MSITIGLHCSRDECTHRALMQVGAQQFFSGAKLRDYFPRGWRVRTPKGEGPALAYCPQHAEDSVK